MAGETTTSIESRMDAGIFSTNVVQSRAARAAFITTRHEAGRVLAVAIDEGQRFDVRSRKTVDSVVGNLAGAAGERLSSLEEAFQERVTRVIRRVGVPTTRELNALSRRVDELSARVKPRTAKKAPRRRTRRAA